MDCRTTRVDLLRPCAEPSSRHHAPLHACTRAQLRHHATASFTRGVCAYAHRKALPYVHGIGAECVIMYVTVVQDACPAQDTGRRRGAGRLFTFEGAYASSEAREDCPAQELAPGSAVADAAREAGAVEESHPVEEDGRRPAEPGSRPAACPIAADDAAPAAKFGAPDGDPAGSPAADALASAPAYFELSPEKPRGTPASKEGSPPRERALDLESFEKLLASWCEPLYWRCSPPALVDWYNECSAEASKDSTGDLPHLMDAPGSAVAFALYSVPGFGEVVAEHFAREKPSGDALEATVRTILDALLAWLPAELDACAASKSELGACDLGVLGLVAGADQRLDAGSFEGADAEAWRGELRTKRGVAHLEGVSVHPIYGGWYAYRGLLILRGGGARRAGEALRPRKTLDCVAASEARRILTEYNLRREELGWRDLTASGHPPERRYSPEEHLLLAEQRVPVPARRRFLELRADALLAAHPLGALPGPRWGPAAAAAYEAMLKAPPAHAHPAGPASEPASSSTARPKPDRAAPRLDILVDARKGEGEEWEPCGGSEGGAPLPATVAQPASPRLAPGKGPLRSPSISKSPSTGGSRACSPVPEDESDLWAFAESLGLDPAMDSDLLWVARRAFEVPLPPGWSEHADESPGAKVFFYNAATQESRWSHPADDVFRELLRLVKVLRAKRPPAPQWRRIAAIQEHLEICRKNAKLELKGWSGPYADEEREYFYHETLGISTWESPVEARQLQLSIREEVLRRCLLEDWRDVGGAAAGPSLPASPGPSLQGTPALPSGKQPEAKVQKPPDSETARNTSDSEPASPVLRRNLRPSPVKTALMEQPDMAEDAEKEVPSPPPRSPSASSFCSACSDEVGSPTASRRATDTRRLSLSWGTREELSPPTPADSTPVDSTPAASSSPSRSPTRSLFLPGDTPEASPEASPERSARPATVTEVLLGSPKAPPEKAPEASPEKAPERPVASREAVAGDTLEARIAEFASEASRSTLELPDLGSQERKRAKEPSTPLPAMCLRHACAHGARRLVIFPRAATQQSRLAFAWYDGLLDSSASMPACV